MLSFIKSDYCKEGLNKSLPEATLNKLNIESGNLPAFHL
jgi:hypothetical protein